jgi:hypothetical protein
MVTTILSWYDHHQSHREGDEHAFFSAAALHFTVEDVTGGYTDPAALRESLVTVWRLTKRAVLDID